MLFYQVNYHGIISFLSFYNIMNNMSTNFKKKMES